MIPKTLTGDLWQGAFTYYEIVLIKSQVELCSQGPQHFVRDIGHDSLVFP